jgi:diacylglycerol kinase family enzyme
MTPLTDAKVTPAFLILNPASGGAAALRRRLTRTARERGLLVRVLAPGEGARRVALEAADDGARALAVAGGDGSVAAVAGVAVERGLPLAVVPTGTLNHTSPATSGWTSRARCAHSTRSAPVASRAWTSVGSTGVCS